MKAQIVSFHCVLKSQMGNVISSTFNHDVITQVEGNGELLSGLAKGLSDLRKGEKRQIFLSAEQAYGFYDPDQVIEVPRKRFNSSQRFTIGAMVHVKATGEEPRWYRVIAIAGDTVTLDGNHPLAGQDLFFDIEATEVRDATPEEIAESCTEQHRAYLH